MSCLIKAQPTFHDFGGNVDPSHSFPFEINGKSPKLISASWETLQNLPRMSPPTSESISSQLLSTNSSPVSSTSSSYLDSILYKIICTPEFLKSAKENYIQPMLDTEFNQIVLPVECGQNYGFMYLTRLCQGSKGPCILFNTCYWLTPNEFQSISGRNSAKDWKRSIRHNGKSIKLLINKGILTVHSPLCDCAYGIEPFVDKYSSSLIIPLDTQSLSYGVDSEGSHSDGIGGSEDDENNGYGSKATSEEGETRILKRKHPTNVEDHISVDDASLNAPKSGGDSAAATENQGEESSSTLSNKNTGNENRDAGSNTGHKSKRKPSTKQVHQLKQEQQSPTDLTSSSPPMTPPPAPTTGSSKNTGDSSPPQQPIKQMEMMSARNYSDIMRNLAAKYNHQSNHNDDYFPNLSFDTRFLKPAAAAAFLNFSQLQAPLLKEKLPFDMSSTQTLLSMMRSASATNNNNSHNNNESKIPSKRPDSPLDLSEREVPPKKAKLKNIDSSKSAISTPNMPGLSCGYPEEASVIVGWSVEEVCQFVSTIDLCKDYVETFREHSIDGSALPLLTEEHLMTAMNMKLGPALKFRSAVSKKLGNCAVCSHCTHCHNHASN